MVKDEFNSMKHFNFKDFTILTCVCVCVCVCRCMCLRMCIDICIVTQIAPPPKQKFLTPPLIWVHVFKI